MLPAELGLGREGHEARTHRSWREMKAARPEAASWWAEGERRNAMRMGCWLVRAERRSMRAVVCGAEAGMTDEGVKIRMRRVEWSGRGRAISWVSRLDSDGTVKYGLGGLRLFNLAS
jgi:hypothetical protein